MITNAPPFNSNLTLYKDLDIKTIEEDPVAFTNFSLLDKKTKKMHR
jgi:hypothetical protein